MQSKRTLLCAAIGLPLFVGCLAVAQNFKPDAVFKAASLAAGHVVGDATWRAENAELAGKAKPGGSGGWLLLDKSYQDVGFHASFLCDAGCKTGVLLHAQKSPDGGLTGIFVSLTDGDLNSYRVAIDANGKELSREKLATGGRGGGGGGGRGGSGGGRGGGRAGGGQAAAQPVAIVAAAPAVRPARGPAIGPNGYVIPPSKGGYHSSDWNEIELLLHGATLTPQINGGNGVTGGSTGEDAASAGGMVALFIGGPGEVRFKDVGLKDLEARSEPAEQISASYKMQRIDEFYYGWSAAVADINHDGIPDIVSGPFYYLGPDYTVRKEIYPAVTYNPGNQYAPDMVNFAYDFTGDGWPDVLSTAMRPMDLYVNPKGENRRWEKFRVLPEITSEIVLMRDLFHDGKMEVIYGGVSGVAWAGPDPANPTAVWTPHIISDNMRSNNHGLGVGDINGDGRLDVLQNNGWWEQPAVVTSAPWTFHPTNFGDRTGGAEMAVYDVNGDGLNDVVTSLDAHGWGLAWYEQKRDAKGAITFVEHMIMDDYSTKNAGDVTFSQLHASTAADMDGDGIPDFITGKRYWSHQDAYGDPDHYGPPVLYVYKTVRNPKAPGGAEFVPELIHNGSGVGSAFAVADLNKDGAMDIVTSTDRGTFIFWGEPRAAAKKTK
jgi:hypothetical protein